MEKKKTGKLIFIDRMKYLSTDFLVYQLSEKINFLEYSSLRLFYVMASDQKREKVKHRMVFFICSKGNN